jgi:hypothetical protein
MTDVGGAADGGARRIGDSERDAATAALDAHREAGRLDAVEYEDRQVQVARARTWSDIQPLFTDLPQPHPAGMPATVGSPGPLTSSDLGSQVAPSLPGQGEGLLGSVVPPQYRTTVMALTPFVALLLFFLTPGPSWIWFLAIPIMGILLYGPDGDDARRRQERLARDERRRVERDRRRYR